MSASKPTPEDRAAFFERLDAAILDGRLSQSAIAARFGINERNVRRRKASILPERGTHVRNANNPGR